MIHTNESAAGLVNNHIPILQYRDVTGLWPEDPKLYKLGSDHARMQRKHKLVMYERPVCG